MPATSFLIDNYRVFHFSEKRDTVTAIILLLNSDKTARATLYFVKSEKVLESTKIAENINNSSAYYHIDRYLEVLDLLRNEGPLTTGTLIPTNSDGYLGIHTDGEIIGEGDG